MNFFAIDPVVRFASLIFVVFTVALSVVLLLPRVKQAPLYKQTISFIKPVLPYFGWFFTLIGSVWAIWGIFQPGEMKLIVGLGLVLSILGIHVVRIAYEPEGEDDSNATNLKVVSLCLTFSLAFIFLVFYGSSIARIFQ